LPSIAAKCMLMKPEPQYYADYLQLESILDAQHPVSFREGFDKAHDEMLFIIIHQAYELWFKQVLFEVDSIIDIMSAEAVNDNGPEMQTIVHRLNRVNTILDVLVHQMDIMETMTPMDFLDFRDLLRPASGFQSWQFKLLEGKLGLPFAQRHGQHYYTSALQPQHKELIESSEQKLQLLPLLNAWLERMPFFEQEGDWSGFTEDATSTLPAFWRHYHKVYRDSLGESEKENLPVFEKVFGFTTDRDDLGLQLSAKACRAALFIMLYPGYPLLQLPFQLISRLMETDEKLSSWRYRHMHMVQRMIGNRIGTGGSSGKNYLKGAADKHMIFKDLNALTSFLIERRHLPKLPKQIAEKLGFAG